MSPLEREMDEVAKAKNLTGVEKLVVYTVALHHGLTAHGAWCLVTAGIL